ncbi:MAG: hypothetical protein Aurels2KO_54540 [Aureliella sp.]
MDTPLAFRTYTVAQAASVLQMGDDAVLAEIKNGNLGASNVSKGTKRPRWRILEEDMVAYLRGLRAPVSPRPRMQSPAKRPRKHIA